MSFQAAVSLSQNTTSIPANSQPDPEKRKLIQQQLVLLLHAHECERKNTANEKKKQQCTLPHCRTMKDILRHMALCTLRRNCTMPHCSSSKQILSHWKHCSSLDCPVCHPLRQTNEDPNVLNSVIFGNQQPRSSTFTTATNNIQSQMSLNVTQQTSINNSPMSQIETSTDGFNQNILPPDVLQNPTSNSLRSVNLQILTSAENVPTSTGQSNVNGQSIRKREWHDQINNDFRENVRRKLIHAILPQRGVIDGKIIHNLEQYARKVESDIYEEANSKSYYYHLISEKYYTIGKELKEKRQKRKEQQWRKQTEALGQQLPTSQSTGAQPQTQSSIMKPSVTVLGRALSSPNSGILRRQLSNILNEPANGIPFTLNTPQPTQSQQKLTSFQRPTENSLCTIASVPTTRTTFNTISSSCSTNLFSNINQQSSLQSQPVLQQQQQPALVRSAMVPTSHMFAVSQYPSPQQPAQLASQPHHMQLRQCSFLYPQHLNNIRVSMLRNRLREQMSPIVSPIGGTHNGLSANSKIASTSTSSLLSNSSLNQQSFQPIINPALLSDVQDDLREHLIHQFMGTISSRDTLQLIIEGEVISDLGQYVRKAESNIYSNATSKVQYYQLLADKFTQIKKELVPEKTK